MPVVRPLPERRPPLGARETLITKALDSEIAAGVLSDLDVATGVVDSADLPGVLTRHITQAARDALAAARTSEDRVALANAVLTALDSPQRVLGQGVKQRQLLLLSERPGPGAQTYAADRPSTPLSDVALMTNAPAEPNLMVELSREMASADRVDLLISFVKWRGLRGLDEPLRDLRRRGVPLRVITTTYVGATDAKALDHLVRLYGAEVKVQYDAERVRLHAKAWYFGRDTGFDTAYVGSSNLSRQALTDGLEWNVRLSRIATEHLVDKFVATFETYWNDRSFQSYDPDADRERLDQALALAGRRSQAGSLSSALTISGLDVRAMPHQSEMLDALEAERVVHHRHANLLVAATGTGKTVVAALDYRNLREAAGRPLRLLFVAHRAEILDQARRTYQEVLRDSRFGEDLQSNDQNLWMALGGVT